MQKQKYNHIKPVLRYLGSKYKLFNQIYPLFNLENIKNFYDVFAGSMIVSVNMKHLHPELNVVVNDYDRNYPLDDKKIEENQKRFNGFGTITQQAVIQYEKKLKNGFNDRIGIFKNLLEKCEIKHLEYMDLLNKKSDWNQDDFLYFDPPYFNNLKAYQHQIDTKTVLENIIKFANTYKNTKIAISFIDNELIDALFKNNPNWKIYHLDHKNSNTSYMVVLMQHPINWKILINNDTNYSFNTDLYNQSFSNHPIVIFYDENNQEVYYLTMKGYKPHHDVLIKQNLYHYLDVDPNFKFNHKPSIIDTTTIYKMDYNEFISTFRVDAKKLNDPTYYRNLDLNTQQEILIKILNNVDNDRVCIKSISNNLSTLNYCSKKWIKKELYNQNHYDTNLLKSYLQIIDQNDINVCINLFLNTHINNNNINTPRHIINYAINDWLDENQINIKHKNYIDLNQYLSKWNPPKSKTEYEP